MKLVIQRVSEGSVIMNGETRSIGAGLVVLLGVGHGSTEGDAAFLADKCLNLRIFADDEGKMNRSVTDIQGDLLVISQFTLYGDCRKGRRPSYTGSAPPETAVPLYEKFVSIVRQSGLTVQTGEFGAMMQVHIENDGPVTMILESEGK